MTTLSQMREGWSCNQKKEVMYHCCIATNECTKQRLCNQKEQTSDKTLLTEAEIQSVRLQIKNLLQPNPELDAENA